MAMTAIYAIFVRSTSCANYKKCLSNHCFFASFCISFRKVFPCNSLIAKNSLTHTDPTIWTHTMTTNEIWFNSKWKAMSPTLFRLWLYQMVPILHRSMLGKAALLFSLSQPKLQNKKAHLYSYAICRRANGKLSDCLSAITNDVVLKLSIHFWVNIAKLLQIQMSLSLPLSISISLRLFAFVCVECLLIQVFG